MGFPLVVQERSMEGFTVLGAQLEHLAYFDPPAADDLAAAVRAYIPFLDLADRFHTDIGEIASRVHMDVMLILLISAAAGILHFHHRRIHQDIKVLRPLQADGADVAGGEAHLLQILIGSHVHIDGIVNMLDLRFIHFVIATNHGQYHQTVHIVHHSLHGLGNRGMEEIAHHFNGMLPWCFHQFLFLVIMNIALHGEGIHSFDIGCKITVFAVYNIRLSGISQHFELMGTAAADGTGICNHRTESQATAGENTGIGIIHELVLLIQPFLIGIKSVAILHNEFAASHKTETGTLFISVLILDLVHRNGQLLVGSGVHLNQGSHQLFMSGAQAVFPVIPVLQLEHLRSEHIPAACLLPQLRRLHNRHHDFLGAGLIDFLADNLLHLLNRTPCQRKEGINPVSNLPHHTGLQHVLMAYHHGISR